MSDQKTLSKSKKYHKLGTFEMVSGVARISDPCYNKKTWCAGKIDNVLNGTWKAEVTINCEEYTYENSDHKELNGKTFDDTKYVLFAIHESFNKDTTFTKVKANIDGGMDAGMAGIFDDKFYKKKYTEDYLQVGNVEYNHKSYSNNKEHDLLMYEAQLILLKSKGGDKDLEKFYEEQIAFTKKLIKNPRGPDYSRARPTRDWYEICCDKSLSNIGAGVIRNGVVSSSGYGDGGYTTYAYYNSDGKVIGIKLRF